MTVCTASTARRPKTGINVGGKSIKVIAERDPANLPWEQMGVDIALECTGLFTSKKMPASI